MLSILLDSLFEILWMVINQEFQQTGKYRFYFLLFVSNTYCGVHPNISVIYLDSFCPQVLKSILKIPTIFGPHGCWSWEVINSYVGRLKKIFLPYILKVWFSHMHICIKNRDVMFCFIFLFHFKNRIRNWKTALLG